MRRRAFLSALALSPLLAQQSFASNDIYLSYQDFQTLKSLNARLKRVSQYVGYTNFNIISYQDALYYARNYSKIGEFNQAEIALMQRLFYEDPTTYGFFGKKTCEHIENVVDPKEVEKVAYSGHYLFKDIALQKFHLLKADVGETLILTSGVRNVMKQLSLYVNKIVSCNANMTQATKSLAPPAYSYHTISDFDVGRIGWGYKNFTSEFARTDEFKKIIDLKYVRIRYTHNNEDGVRYEPWHVEVS